MARSFVVGTLWGTAVAVIGLGVASVSTQGPYLQQPEPVVDAPPDVANPAAPILTETPLSAGRPAPEVAEVNEPVASAPDTLAALVEDARRPAAAPEARQAGSVPLAPAVRDRGEALNTTQPVPVPRATSPAARPTSPLRDTAIVQPPSSAEPAVIASTAPVITPPPGATPAPSQVPDTDVAASVSDTAPTIADAALPNAPDLPTASAPIRATIASLPLSSPADLSRVAGAPSAGADVGPGDQARQSAPLRVAGTSVPSGPDVASATAPITASIVPAAPLSVPRLSDGQERQALVAVQPSDSTSRSAAPAPVEAPGSAAAQPATGTNPAPVSAATEVAVPGEAVSGRVSALDAGAAITPPLPAPLPAPPPANAADASPQSDTPADPPAPQVRVVPRTSQGDGATSGSTFQSSVSSRLPRVGANPAPEPEIAETEAPKAAETDLRPVVQFAEPIERDPARPLMAIVLIDDGVGPGGADLLDGFPYPVSVAVDPTSATARDRAKAYRAIGLEVLALATLPEGAVAQDVEVGLAASLAAVPEAVALMERDEAGLQTSRATSDQVAAILAQSGHGLLLFPKGLNTGASLASKAGVPAATVFRDFDGKGQTPRVMRRFLDQAAFKARQEDNVVMVGRMRPDTISALLLWGLQDRAAQVGLVPVSMVLK